jgi:hypothetical protein
MKRRIAAIQAKAVSYRGQYLDYGWGSLTSGQLMSRWDCFHDALSGVGGNGPRQFESSRTE